jgi:anti-sigma B factor antagonist
MQYQVSANGTETTLFLRHHLAFADRRAFLEAIPEFVPAGTTRLVVDMRDLRFLDSAGLGMLLSLKEAAEKQGAQMVIREPVAGVKTLLKLAQFENLFAIEYM